MTQKYHRIWLYGLLAFSILACVTFYFQDSFSDNIYTITSSNNDYSYLSYFFYSLMDLVNMVVGPWILVATSIYLALFYTKLRRSDKAIDYFAPIIILILSLSLCDVFIPALVGPALHYLLASIINMSGYLPLISLVAAAVIVYFWVPVQPLSSEGALKQRLLKFALLFNPYFSRLKRFLPLPQKTLETVPAHTSNLSKESHIANFQTGEQIPLGLDLESSESNQGNEMESIIAGVDVKGDLHKNTEALPHSEIGPNLPLAPKCVTKELSKTLPAKAKNKTLPRDYFKLVDRKMRTSGPNRNAPEKDYFDSIITRIEDKLAEFRINGTIINILKGPVVDTFELELGNGVKVSKITSITEDMSLALFGAPIRIVYPMKGKNTVGIEVPRNPREIIYLGEILESDAWRQNSFALPLAMGKDAFGAPFVVDLASMPHMLVAGATGAGKSVFINALLMSLLVKRSPEQMRLILIDPKQLELALYAKLPHLILPVLTDAKSASAALLYAVQEMERRYSILKEFAVRNIEGFNRKMKSPQPEQLELIRKHYPSGTDNFELPYLVIIVDEFADLILTKSGKDIENNICRLAAKARASGIHLVLATQRPSVDVITGLIKSNFPTRVSFRVTTSIDSRTILNAQGAELLLGKGDMLYKHGPEMTRVHSSFVEEDEIEAFTAELCTYEHEFDPEALDFLEGQQSSGAGTSQGHFDPDGSYNGEGEDDDLYEQAVHIVAECRTASASMLQRRLKIGYNRAANLVELMEARGVVGPAQGSKARKVLVAPPSADHV